MRKTQLLSPSGLLVSQLTFVEATHFLHHGLARIVKFYPYTLQLKENNPPGPDENEFYPFYMPKKPHNLMSAKVKLRGMQSFA